MIKLTQKNDSCIMLYQTCEDPRIDALKHDETTPPRDLPKAEVVDKAIQTLHDCLDTSAGSGTSPVLSETPKIIEALLVSALFRLFLPWLLRSINVFQTSKLQESPP